MSKVLLFVAIQAISFVLTLIGFPVLAVACYFKLWTAESPPQWKSRLLWIYGNKIDGIAGTKPAPFRSTVILDGYQVFYWSAIRNSCNNLRFTRFANRPGYPLWYRTFGNYYAKAGWLPEGYPVISVGKGKW